MAKNTPPTTTGFKSYALSDQGVRANNEDEVFADDERGIYFVIDGMGGHAAGEQAAQIAGERLRGRLERATGTPQQRIREAIALANNAIFETAAQHPEWTGMACVLTVALLSPDTSTATIGHVGDSRLYKIRGAASGNVTLEKITRDHSPVGELEDAEELTEAGAMAHPRRNEVYRDVGSTLHDPNDKDFIDVYEIPAEPDSGLLLCSDGLTDALPIADIKTVISENMQDRPAAVRALINQAINRDAKDNISVVLVLGPNLGGPTLGRAAPAALPTPAAPMRIQLARSPRRSILPLWRRVAWPILWIALGAALLFGIQQFLSGTPPKAAATTPKTPTTIFVNARQPSAQPTIAAALAIANDGDIIELAPGIYEEPVDIEKSNILIDGSGALLRPKPVSKASNEGVDGITVTSAAGVRIQNLRISGDNGGDNDGDLLTGIHIVNSQLSLRNVHVAGADGPGVETAGSSTLRMEASSVRDCAGPGLLLRGAIAATVRYSAIVGNGRDPHGRQPGILIDSSLPIELLGNTIANNGGPAIAQRDLPTQEVLNQNLFSLDGRRGRLDDIRVTAQRVHPKREQP